MENKYFKINKTKTLQVRVKPDMFNFLNKKKIKYSDLLRDFLDEKFSSLIEKEFKNKK